VISNACFSGELIDRVLEIGRKIKIQELAFSAIDSVRKTNPYESELFNYESPTQKKL